MISRLRQTLRLRSRSQRWRRAGLAAYKLLRYEASSAPRYGRAYVRSYSANRLPVQDELPLITLKATEFLRQLATAAPPLTVFEYGCGGTTAFVSRYAQRHSFVENIPGYCDFVLQTLQQRGRHNLEAHCIPADPISADSPAPHPELPWVNYRSIHKGDEGYDFSAYVRAVDAYPDASFDLVLVDGRARMSCVYHALPKVRPGGWLMMDDSNRQEYQPAFAYLEARYKGVHCRGLRPYHTMLHLPSTTQQQTSFWQIGLAAG